MPTFRYLAADAEGALCRGHLTADDEAAALAQLRGQSRLLMRLDPVERPALIGWLNRDFGTRRGLSRAKVAEITRELAIMLASGQDLDAALRFLVETATGVRARGVLQALRDAVRDGVPLADALARHPESFPKLYIGLVRAGETGGRLAQALDRLAALLEHQRALAATVQSAMIYPVLLLVAAIGSVALMLTTVLPQFAPLFAQNGATLPTSTRLLIAAGDAVAAHGMIGLLACAFAFLVAKAMLRQPGPRTVADRLLLWLPVVGPLQREVLAARFTRTLGTLLGNGVPLIAALETVRDVMGNRTAMAAVDQATQSARGGGGVARALTAAGVFPARTGHLLRLGEDNAQLGAMALRAAEIHEERTRQSVERLVSLMVPAVTIVMGAVIAGIVASLLLAMLSLNDLAA